MHFNEARHSIYGFSSAAKKLFKTLLILRAAINIVYCYKLLFHNLNYRSKSSFVTKLSVPNSEKGFSLSGNTRRELPFKVYRDNNHAGTEHIYSIAKRDTAIFKNLVTQSLT